MRAATPKLVASLRDHARRTLHEEPGCLRFEVIRPIDTNGNPIGNRVMVSELYASEAAFAAHKANPRMPGLAGQERTAAEVAPASSRACRSMSRAVDDGMQPEELNAANDG